jgi:hypothetical protein
LALNSRGQAALTDALYFLLIVSALSTMLFFFAANYGQTVEQRVVNQYWREYATGALETILYSSTPRISTETLEKSTEIDYLLAAVKEDYADDRDIDETEDVLIQNITGIMQPFAGNFDYLFYVYLSDEKKFAFVMVYTREEPSFEVVSGSGIDEVRRVKPGDAKIMLCKPNSLNALESMVESVGLSAQSTTRIQLVEVDASDKSSYPVAQANLTIWIPTPIGSFLDDPIMNCAEKDRIPAPSLP